MNKDNIGDKKGKQPSVTLDRNSNSSILRLYRFIIDSIPVAVIAVDARLKITSYNPWAEKLTGYSVKEAKGHHCGDILKGGMCKRTCPLKRVIKGSDPVVRVETTIQNKDGETIPVRMNAAVLLDDNDDLLGGVETFQDISQLKALEREKANLISMIAHDIKSPIVTIGGFALRLLKKDLGMDKEKQKQYVEIISREAVRAELLVNDFLEFSRLDSGTLKLTFGRTSLDKELGELFKTYESRALEGGIRLRFEGLKTLSVIEADAKRLRMVFANLLDNALKFSKDEGAIAIATRETDTEVTVEIRDEGSGIDAEEIPYIFEPFHRGRGIGEQKGFGLGLAIVKAIVKGHGGRIFVKSELGKGSIFTVVLPKSGRPENG